MGHCSYPRQSHIFSPLARWYSKLTQGQKNKSNWRSEEELVPRAKCLNQRPSEPLHHAAFHENLTRVSNFRTRKPTIIETVKFLKMNVIH